MKIKCIAKKMFQDGNKCEKHSFKNKRHCKSLEDLGNMEPESNDEGHQMFNRHKGRHMEHGRHMRHGEHKMGHHHMRGGHKFDRHHMEDKMDRHHMRGGHHRMGRHMKGGHHKRGHFEYLKDQNFKQVLEFKDFDIIVIKRKPQQNPGDEPKSIIISLLDHNEGYSSDSISNPDNQKGDSGLMMDTENNETVKNPLKTNENEKEAQEGKTNEELKNIDTDFQVLNL